MEERELNRTKLDRIKIAKALAEPFPASEIEWRVGSTTKDKSKGMALAYLTSRACQDRLDEVVGPDGWQTEIQIVPGGVLCRLGLKIGGEWVWKTDGSDNSDTEPFKGGISGAIKRAAVQFGVGRYLYYLPSGWFQLVQKGRSHVFAQTPTLPPWALPGGRGRPPQRAEAPTSHMSAPEPEAQEPPQEVASAPDSPPGGSEVRDEVQEPRWDGKPFLDLAFKMMPSAFPPDQHTWRHMLAGKPDGGRRSKLRWLMKRKADEGSMSATFIEMALDYAAAREAAGNPITEDECVPF